MMTNDDSAKVASEAVQYYVIGESSLIPDGERLVVDIDGRGIAIFNVNGTFYAIGDECTHDEGSLGEGQLDGFVITCPRHGACYDIRSGAALSLPAVFETPVYPVRVKDGNIEIGIPR